MESNAIWYFVAAAVAAGFGMAIGTLSTARAQGNALSEAMKGIARQPESAKSMQTPLVLGLAFIEALTLYVLLVIIFLLFPFTQNVMKLLGH